MYTGITLILILQKYYRGKNKHYKPIYVTNKDSKILYTILANQTAIYKKSNHHHQGEFFQECKITLTFKNQSL